MYNRVRRNANRLALMPIYRPLSLLNEFEDIGRKLWDSWQPGLLDLPLLPHTDMYEKDDEFIVKTELPGVSEKDIEVTFEDDVLTVKAEKKDEAEEDATKRTHERFYGQYYRSMFIPFHIESGKILASFKDGVLEVRLPKAEEAKPKRIDVKVKAESVQGGRKTRRKKS